jgi:quercetin dioxygenase-like cupin family protein
MNRAHASVLSALALSFASGAGAMWAQQQAQRATRREPQFENEYVRAWKSIIMPKQPLAMHRHDHGRALIALNGGQLKVVDKDGNVLNTYRWERGKAYWLVADPPGQMHADLNDTSRPIEVIVVELKQDKPALNGAR